MEKSRDQRERLCDQERVEQPLPSRESTKHKGGKLIVVFLPGVCGGMAGVVLVVVCNAARVPNFWVGTGFLGVPALPDYPSDEVFLLQASLCWSIYLGLLFILVGLGVHAGYKKELSGDK